MAFDHGEDYTVRLREHTDTTLLPGVILVATTTDVEEEDGHDQEVVCGVISGVIKEVLFPSADTPVKCGYIFSLRVHPDYRRFGVAMTLLSSLEEWLVEHGAVLSYGYIAEGNEASERFFAKNGYGKLPSLRLLGILVQNMPKPVPDWVETQLFVEEEERTEEKRQAKADEAVESIHTFWGQADFLLPRDSLRRVLADLHSSGPYVITSTDGESEAGCSVWGHGYSIKLLGAPWYIRSGISVINRLAGFLPSLIPSLPDIGKKDHLDMRTVFGVWVKGTEGPALLSHLLAHVHNTLIKEDVDYLSVPLANGHPLAASVPASSLIETSTLPVLKGLTSEGQRLAGYTSQKTAAHVAVGEASGKTPTVLPHFFDPRS